MPDSDSPPPSRDFQRLRQSGHRAGVSLLIGRGFCAARDGVARGLIAMGFTPNLVTTTGLVFTVVAGWCLAHGAGHQVPYFYDGQGPVSYWPLWAALLLIGSGACDMLDGAVARVGNLASPFGAVLDSTLDRLSDMAIFIGCATYYWRAGDALWFVPIAALCNAFMISYIKARAENVIPDCAVGYWLRGERFAAVLIGCLCGHVIAALWLLAVLAAFTVLRRFVYAWQAVEAQARQAPPPARGPTPGTWHRLLLWRYPRGSVPYDLVTGFNIALIVFGPQLYRLLIGD